MAKTLGELLIESEQAFGNAVALQSMEGETTFRQLAAGAAALAAALRTAGAEGGRIGVLLPNLPVFAVASHAIFRIGGSALLLNPANSPREVAEQLADAGVDRVLTISRLRELLPQSATSLLLDDYPRVVRVVRGEREDEVRVGSTAGGAAAFAGPEDEAVVIYTSAMEGRARGAVLRHRNLVANLHSTIDAMGLTPADRLLAVLPFAHAFGLTVCLNAPLAAGSTILPVPKFSPAGALEMLETQGVTVLCGVPSMYMGLLSAAEKRGVPEHGLRVALSGGAPMPLELPRRWEERFGIPLRQGYGLTEAAPVCLFNRVDRPNRIGTLGWALPGVEISIRDEAGCALGEEEVGELWVKGENVFAGYLGDSVAPGPVQGRWLRTGDLASVEDGAIRFRGTLKAMFTRNGFNVYPEEIRRVLREDPRIDEVMVCARPDLEKENEVVVAVAPAVGATLTVEDVRQLCADRLAAYKRPSSIVIAG
jgi:long-chain acyl-CoA synthetase